MAHYNLLDAGWIPCLRAASAPPEYLSIREVLHQAPALRRIADPAPTVTASIYRLLLAILHRSLDGPRDPAEWGEIMRRGAWDMTRIEAYLTRWSHRFDLVSEQWPFYQTPGLAVGAFKEINQLTHERASDRNRPLLFDHSLPGRGISPGAAARYLVAQQNFSVGGMFTPSPGGGDKFAPASPLLRSFVCLVAGKTIFETLMLNWMQYNRDAEMPFVLRGDDQPAWERDEPVSVVERFPAGWVDLLTWQCRRILLRASVDAAGNLSVSHVALMQGYRFPPSFEMATSETMVAYVEFTRPNQDSVPPWLPIGLTTGRSAWRDSAALFQTIDTRRRPRTLDWLQRLMAEGFLTTRQVFPLDVYGILTAKANIEDWRHETLPLPGEFIARPEMVEPLRRGLELADRVGQLLTPRILNLPTKPRPVRGPSPMRVLGEELLRCTSERAPHGESATALANHMSPEASYWGSLGVPFRAFVTRLPSDFTIDAYGDLAEQGEAAIAWGRAVEASARACFGEVVHSIESSARTLRAAALAEERFSRCLNDILADYGAKVPPGPAAPALGAAANQ